jgi:hypothetical protein
VGSLTGSNSSISTLGAAGVANPAGSLPVLGSAMGGLNGLLNVPGLLGALAQGARLDVGSVRSSSDYVAVLSNTAVAAPTPAQAVELPRTGGTGGGPLAALAGLLVVLSMASRRWVRRASVA